MLFRSLNNISKKIIHVNQHVIKRNSKTGDRYPVLTVKSPKSNIYAHEVIIKDAQGNEVAKVVYSPDKPLSCGAKVWIETNNNIELFVREDVTNEHILPV